MLEITQKPHLHASWIDPDAVDIVRRLQKAGFVCYLVGGCVRDLLAGIHPKDYDIATDAAPNMVKKKVWNSYVIGRRFRLVLVKRDEKQFEVATFRREALPEELIEDEDTPTAENFFGTPEQDALRRDFTINALFYDPIKSELIDFAKGMDDIKACILRMIGDPTVRIIEDPIRSLRAIRLSHKLSFQIEPSFRQAIKDNAEKVLTSNLPRRREEYLKFLRLKEPLRALTELYDLDLMKHLLPTLHEIFSSAALLEIFNHYFIQGAALIPHPVNPVENYFPLILAMSRAFEDDPQSFNKMDLFMKNELGMFKTEQADIFNVFEMSKSLPDIASFKKRGSRRQAAFLSQPALGMALRLIRMDTLLNPTELTFWEGALRFSQEL